MKIHAEFNSLSDVASFVRYFSQFDAGAKVEKEEKNDWKWKYERTAANLERALMRIAVLDPKGKSANMELTPVGTSVDELELSCRASNCLKAANVATIERLLELSANDLFKIDNLGKTTLKEIITALDERGLKLRNAP